MSYIMRNSISKTVGNDYVGIHIHVYSGREDAVKALKEVKKYGFTDKISETSTRYENGKVASRYIFIWMGDTDRHDEVVQKKIDTLVDHFVMDLNYDKH